jgi:hypothetical protein
VSLSPDSATQLGIYAQVAVGFAGFAGVIGAYSRFRIHALATAFRVRAMIALAMMVVVFALLPMLTACFGLPETVNWRVCGGLLAVCGAAAVAVMAPQAAILYRIGRLMRVAAYVLCVVAVLVLAPLFATAAGFRPAYAQACYFATLFFGMVVCAYHFVMVMMAVRLDDSE